MSTNPPRDLFTLAMDDGAKIVIRRGGNPNGTRLYLSNGNGFAIDGYRVFWEKLLADFDLILFDMRNHGRNEQTGADGHHYFQMAKDIGTVFRGVDKALGHRPSVGVFHSMSARAAMKHAVEMEKVWDALFLFDPPNVPPRGHAQYESMRIFELRLVEWAVARQDRFASIEELHAFFSTNRAQSRWQAQAREDMAKAILRADGRGGFMLTCQRELEASIYLAALTLELWPDAKSFGMPVKLIGADPGAKGASPTSAANAALAAEGGYEYEAVPETGHLLQIERPDACREAMLSYLRKLVLTA
jgi:pimeloyl-ACP methyl ester carboxylesterase